jgi:hypothetical protein
MARKNRQKPEEKSMDFLDTFNIEQQKEEKVEEVISEIAPEIEIKEEIKPEKDFLYKVKVTHPSLRMRRAPNTHAEVYGLITDQGIYEIVDEVNGWGKLKNDCWIMLSYTQIV